MQDAISPEFPEFSGSGTGVCTKLDVPSRIRKVGEQVGGKAGSRFLAAYALVYFISSEIIHGSPYGVNYVYQAHLPLTPTLEDFEDATVKQLEDLLLAVSHAVAGYVSTFFRSQGMQAPYQYSAFCEHYRRWRQQLTTSMRQTHTPGERLFIDYAGQTVGVTDGSTGEIRNAQVFVAVLGASNYTYIEATWSQQLPDWIGSHVRALAFFGGCTELWVPDNLRSGVTKASRYEPDVNPTYHDLAEHYGVAVLPARARRPKDKAKVENGVLVVTRWVLARLRHQRFFSLNELNRSLRTLLTDLNQRPFKKLPGSRASAFAEMDQPALRALPEQHYEYAEWKVARVGVDYHVEVDGHYYSVPCQHARAQVDVRMTRSTVEVFQRGQRIASHAQCAFKGRHTTVAAHMPPAHREVAGWNAQTLTARAEAVGPRCAVLVERLLVQRQHPQQAFRSCLGVLSLGQKYGIGRLEAACARALKHSAVSWKSVQAILKNNLDLQQQDAQRTLDLPEHENLRGAAYYQSSQIH